MLVTLEVTEQRVEIFSEFVLDDIFH